MLAISIWNPYAALLARRDLHGLPYKEFETRTWKTSYRGPIAIHAATSVESIQNIIRTIREQPHSEKAMFYREVFQTLDGVEANLWKLPRGVVIATGDLVAIFRGEELTRISWRERLVGNFGPGYFGWKIENVKLLPQPIKARGMPGLWEWNPAA